jgi:protein-S-isoprenylcysteine O-methyltransferase Ste14
MDMSNPPGKSGKAPPRPKSAVSTGVGVVGLIGMFSWIAIARYYGMDGPWSALMNVAWCGIPMVLWSLFVDKVHRNPSTGIDWDSPAKRSTETRDISLTKLAGLWATWGGIAAIYGLCRWYWSGSYLFSMEIFEFCAVPLFLLSIPYVMWLDTRLKEPRDGAWHFGRWLMGRDGWTGEAIQNHWRSWTVKGFFIAFMFSIVPGGFAEFIRTPMSDVLANPVRLGLWLIGLMFVIDVAFATVGYLLTMKPLDAHIRSANPFLGGWVAALLCYPPFALMNGGGVLDYRPGTESWIYWFEGHDWILAVWAGVLVLLTGIYAWATIAFGLRFSNLTYRGVLTHGPYAWTKHPAYLAKNTFWWLETLPFLVTSQSIADAVRNTVILGLVSAVYFWRAKTEEAHLRRDDPAYAEYAAWMDSYGPITSRINRLIGRRPAAMVPVPAE